MIMKKYRALAASVLALGGLLALAYPGQTTAAAAPKADASAAKATDADWRLVWSDEFNTDGPPDPANWDYEHGFVRNNELQWYQPENATCKGGILTIEARREHKPNPAYRPGRRGMSGRQFIEYTSACLITRRKHEFKYGKFELRGRIDVRPGSWPAFWSLGIPPQRGIHWPTSGEVDTMEYYRGDVLANVCYGRNDKEMWKTVKTPYASLGGEAWAKQFHTWTMEWDEKKIDLYLDGKLMNHFDVTSATLENGFNAFHNPQYLLVNQAIGGKQGGDPSKTEFPVKFEVDWVRVYQRKQ